jgi:hypothetical protein
MTGLNLSNALPAVNCSHFSGEVLPAAERERLNWIDGA